LIGTKKIKLFIDAHCFDDEFQGTRTFIKELYREFVKLSSNFEYYIAAVNIENLKNEFDFIPEVHFIQYTSNSSFKRIFFETPRILKQHQIDVAHFQYIAPFQKVGKYIVTTHDILFNDFKSEFSFLYRFSRNFLFKRSIQQADIQTTVSNYSRERLVHHYGLNAQHIHIIPNGVNSNYFDAFLKNKTQEYIRSKYGIKDFILYVSRIEPRKNNILLLEAYLDLKLYEKDLALVFIGKTSIRTQGLEVKIDQMPIEAKKRFFHLEQVNEHDLLKFYQSAKVFVYPSKAEGFGIPPLEAAALKVPVLCSNKTAMKDYTFFGDHLFDPENKEELKQKLNKLLMQEDDTNYLRISEQIKQRYSWKTGADKLYSLLRDTFSELC
jgi:glycosyltransferase involved in cell wall biosynthesis